MPVTKQYLDNKKGIVKQYKDILMDMIPLNLPGIPPEELSRAIDYSINKRYKEETAEVYNNYTKKRAKSTLLDTINFIINKKPICCASGVMFKKHDEARNPLIPLITSYLNNRKAAKKKMFTFPKGSADFEKYNLMQLLYKIDKQNCRFIIVI